MSKKIRVEIEEVNSSSGIEFQIQINGGNDLYTVAKCWDYLLAERIRSAVAEYIKDEYKVVGQEDAEMIDNVD